MTHTDGLRFGWVDTSIRQLVETRPAAVTYAYALITCVDSTTDLSHLKTARAITQRHPQCGFLGTALVIPGELLADIVTEFNLFNGFDEAWFFRNVPQVAKPDDVSLVAPLDLRQEAIPQELRDWMRASGCELGLGDGGGLNYVTLDERVAVVLERDGLERSTTWRWARAWIVLTGWWTRHGPMNSRYSIRRFLSIWSSTWWRFISPVSTRAMP